MPDWCPRCDAGLPSTACSLFPCPTLQYFLPRTPLPVGLRSFVLRAPLSFLLSAAVNSRFGATCPTSHLLCSYVPCPRDPPACPATACPFDSFPHPPRQYCPVHPLNCPVLGMYLALPAQASQAHLPVPPLTRPLRHTAVLERPHAPRPHPHTPRAFLPVSRRCPVATLAALRCNTKANVRTCRAP